MRIRGGTYHFQPQVRIAKKTFIDYSMANRKIAYTLGRGPAYISDMSSASGYMGAKYFQEFGQVCLTCAPAPKGHIYKGGGFLLSYGSSQGGL